MSLGVNLLMYLTQIVSESLNNEYLSKILEIHHKHKKDYPSGTALMLGKGIANGKNKDLNSLIGKKFLNKKTQGLVDSPVTVSLPGGSLRINWPGEGHSLIMIGPAITSFHGQIKL